MNAKTYLLVAAALTFGAVVLPTPASALSCTPIDTGELVREARCLSGIDQAQCNGSSPAAGACVAALQAADAAFDKAEWAEDLARGLAHKVYPGIDVLLP